MGTTYVPELADLHGQFQGPGDSEWKLNRSSLMQAVFWHSKLLHTSFLILCSASSAWNGANYFFEVFAHRYVDSVGIPHKKKKWPQWAAPFKVLQSCGEGLSAESCRILREGRKWLNPGKSNRGRETGAVYYLRRFYLCSMTRDNCTSRASGDHETLIHILLSQH